MSTQNDTSPVNENKLIAERREKLAQIRTQGTAYPNHFRPKDQAQALQDAYADKEKDELEGLAVQATVAGRMMLKRVMGRASFATLQDSSGRIQIYLDKRQVGDECYAQFKNWDIGDIVGVQGTLFKTNRGELTIQVSQIELLAKALRPLPDKFHGLSDQEIRYRQRYVDLIMNEDVRLTFQRRSQAIMNLRQLMREHDFLEVETPMLQPIPGGATAKPFITHHNALDMDMYLRVAPELYLKRLIVGGFERVFEINRNFRNEGVSPRHNPEFTMMEFYAAYSDYKWVMDFTEALIRYTAQNTCGDTLLNYQDKALDLGQPFDRLTIVQAISKYAPQYAEAPLDDEAFLRHELEKLKVDLQDPAFLHAGVGALQLALFEETVEELLWHPTFIVDYPIEVSPLARASDQDPTITERFELFITGREIANGFSEHNDYGDQAACYTA